MSDEALFPMGTVIVIKDGAKTSTGYQPTRQVLYVGPAGRGLHGLAVSTHHAPYYRNRESDIESGARVFPNLRWASWSPRKVKTSTIVGSQADETAKWEASCAAKEDQRQADERDAKDRAAGHRVLVQAFDAWFLENGGGMAYPQHDGTYVAASGDQARALAALIASAVKCEHSHP